MTSKKRLSTGSSPGLPRVGSQDQPLYWTDDIPVCFLSGVGFSTNQTYREDGFRREDHEFEDRSFHFKLENGVYLYGVFDGHDGSKASNFAAQRLPAEVVFGQLTGKTDDEEILNVLHQAFISVEKAYFDSISDVHAEKCNLQEQIPEGINSYEAYRQFPDLHKRLEAIEEEIRGGATAVVCLIVNNTLYVANTGCCRALLCTTDTDGVLRVMQLTVNHDLTNEDELQRLSELGLDVGKLRQVGQLGNHTYTRTIGDYHVKGGYKEIDVLCTAMSDPVVAEPQLNPGYQLDDDCRFLVIMSGGLYRSLEAVGMESVNREIASMVAAEFASQSTLNGVAQAVVDKVVRIHHDSFLTAMDDVKQRCQTRDDITLLVRNFNYPLPNALNTPSPAAKASSVRSPFFQSPAAGGEYALLPGAGVDMAPLSVVIPSGGQGQGSPAEDHRPMFSVSAQANPGTSTLTNTSLYSAGTLQSSQYSSTGRSNVYTSSNDSTQSGDGEPSGPFTRQSKVKKTMSLDADGRVEAYIDFSGYHKAVAELTDAQREALTAETEPRPAYEAIPEEAEPGHGTPAGRDSPGGEPREAGRPGGGGPGGGGATQGTLGGVTETAQTA
nr:TGF-beta-activated kinase 1 and MAP3K7-binding protein 1 [Arenicola marina]